MEDDEIDDYEFELYKERWNKNRKTAFDFDQWCKDLDEHPAFMQKFPEDGPLSEAAEALQALKYDQEASLEERAKNFKDDGNAHFAKKKYRDAILAYTEGIKLNCPDVEMSSSLYNNRAASHFRLENYRSAFKDCLFARRLKPDYEKVFIRGIECLLKLNSPEEAMRWIEEGSPSLKSSKDVIVLTREVEKLLKEKNKEMRKLQIQEKKKLIETKMLLDAFKKRNIKFREKNLFENFNTNSLLVTMPQCQPCRVHFNEENILVWPVLVTYPEYNTTDFVQEFSENTNFYDQFQIILADKPHWDEKDEYNLDSIEIYFDFYDRPDTVVQVPVRTTLATVLSNPKSKIFKGLPTFIVLSKKSEFHSTYFDHVSVESFD